MILEEERNYYQLLRFRKRRLEQQFTRKESRIGFEHDRFYDLVRTGQLLQHLRFMERALLETRVVSFALIHYTGKRIIYTKSKLLI
jgi:hypothetical protein